MRQTGPQNPYESYCYHCNVTAPGDARTCVHCGGRLSKQQGEAPIAVPMPFAGQPTNEDDLDAPRRMGGASPMTAVWILLFLVGTVYRVCA